MSGATELLVLNQGDRIRITFKSTSRRKPLELDVTGVERSGASVLYKLSDYKLGWGFQPSPNSWMLEWGGITMDDISLVEKI